LNKLKIISVSRKTTSFSPVDEAKVKRPEKQNNTKNLHTAHSSGNLPTLANTCQYLPVLDDEV